MTRRANRKKRLTVLYIVEHPNQEGDTCIDWTSQYCWTNGWNCLWRGHSVYQNRPLIPQRSVLDESLYLCIYHCRVVGAGHRLGLRPCTSFLRVPDAERRGASPAVSPSQRFGPLTVRVPEGDGPLPPPPPQTHIREFFGRFADVITTATVATVPPTAG